METEINFFTESIAGDAMFEGLQSDFNMQSFNYPEPEDDEEEDKDKDDDNDKANESTNDDPPLDEKVVHSPVTTQPGGRPK